MDEITRTERPSAFISLSSQGCGAPVGNLGAGMVYGNDCFDSTQVSLLRCSVLEVPCQHSRSDIAL